MCMNSELTPFYVSLFSSFIYSLAFKAMTHTTTAAVHEPEPMASTHSTNEPTMDLLTMDPSSRSSVPSTVTNTFKEKNRGDDGQCETIKMATKEENFSGIVLTKEDDNKRRLKIITNESDATTKFANAAAAEG